MNIDNFYKKVITLVPMKQESNNFITELEKVFNKYLVLLTKNQSLLGENSDKLIAEINEICKKIIDSIDYYLKGMHSYSYSIIEQVLSKHLIDGHTHEIKENEIFYRARLFDNNRQRSYKEMFHIPLSKRERVKTQRFSAPGYPCLYLCSSVNACWEELGQPRFDDLMISRFITRYRFKVVDLRTPQLEDFINNLDIILKRIPLIISSSVCVNRSENPFKPEFIIPQLIIEYIITTNQKKYISTDYSLFDFILGVYYTSTHINNDLKFPLRTFENIALPAVLVDRKTDYCQLLASCFEWTNPTCYEYEDILKKITNKRIERKSTPKMCESEYNYKYSKMGELEERMAKLPTHKFPFLVIGKDKIKLNYQGDKVSVVLRSSGKWKIT